MLIDWFTVSAQAVNFLALVWLLRRFLYRPVLAAIDARERQIAAKLADAAARESQAQTEREALRKRNEGFELERAGLLREASDAAMAERQRLLEAARQDSEQLRARLEQALASERSELRRQLFNQTQAEVLAVARGALADLAGASLESRMVEVFIERLRSLPPASVQHVLVRSAFQLQPGSQAAIGAAVRDVFGEGVVTTLQVSPEVVCGIELTQDGTRLAWSIGDYLAALATNVAAINETRHANG